MNEAGATVTITFEDSSVFNMGVLPKGTTNFNIGSHTSFRITCFKEGNGTPALISNDADTYSSWDTPRGVAVSKNAMVGTNFGRLCVGNATTVGKGLGLFLLNSDQTLVKGNVGSGFWAGGGSGPWRIRAQDDGTFLASDFSTANACLLQFSPDLSSSNLVLAIIGQTAAAAQGIHGDLFGCGTMRGSLAQSNLVLYTFDSGMGTPADTNCIKGPLTSPGSFNCVFQYNIGAGPLPWNKRPDYAYTYGLDGIAELRTEGDVGKDGKIICGFGRANASNPNLQILRPFVTTNGITGDPANQALQDAAKSATNWVYTGGASYNGAPFNTPPNGGSAGDPWVGLNGSGSAGGTYAGVRVSPDGKYLASVDVFNGATIATLTNGIPNEGTIFGIQNAANIANSRGMDWDPADNLWIISSGTGQLRCYSLGLTTTCVTSNDWTGTNGTFQLLTPPLGASLAIVSPTASQNYVNNAVNPGAPIPAVFRITLSSSDTTASGPVTVGFARTGTGVYTNNYIINTNETPNGVAITPNAVIFPAGVFAGSNGPNWNVDVKIIPTAIPVSGPTLSVNVRLNSGTNYSAAFPLSGGMAILNTGPQLLQLSAAAPNTLGGMNRGIPNDQARFIITRLGDTNGPGNDAINPVVQRAFTVTNIDYLPPASGASFMARLGTDFTAGAQNFNGGTPSDGSPGIVVNPGDVTINALIGNPVKHLNTNLRRTNLVVLVNLTNTTAIGTPPSTTNVVSSDGFPYSVSTTTLTLSEFDNALGGEVVLWSNPLTNSLDSTNWTLVFANINQGQSATLPTVISNYDNSASGFDGPYTAAFGKSVNDPNNDGGVSVPPSDAMVANGWTTALKVSVNKAPGLAGESGVNLYPQIPGAPWGPGNYKTFQGNYALRFDMFLSLYDNGLFNPVIGTPAREFAAFGINHHGTNANWRLDINPRGDGTGARPINADGEWCTIGAASGSITPADYDMFISPPFALVDANGAPVPQVIPYTTNLFTNLVNATTAYFSSPSTNAYQTAPGVYSGVTNVFNNGGVPNDQQSANNGAFGGAPQNGIIKYPPFQGINNAGGAPDNAWVDVSLELTRQTNLTLLVAQQAIFNSSTVLPAFGTQNPLAPFGGTPMLGYLDPNRDISDYSAFVYFSNVRLVELSPFIPWTNQPVLAMIVTQGTSFSLSSGATFASNPLTNIWYLGSTNGTVGPSASHENGRPLAGIVTNIYNSTNGLATLAVNNIQAGTNYISTWSDQAGAVTNYMTTVEVIAGPGDKTVLLGANTSFAVTASGQNPPTSYQWKFFGTNLVNSTHYAGVTSPTLFITNVTAGDAGVYSNLATAQLNTGVTNAATAISVVTAGTLSVKFGFDPYEFTVVTNDSTTVGMAFTTTDPTDTTGSFTLQSAGVVTGPYTNNATGVFSGANPNFLVTVPRTGEMMFYRLRHN